MGISSVPEVVVVTRNKTTLRLIDSAFVPDENKVELRNRLARVKGQVEGIERMLAANRPCIEMLTQLAAAQEALRGAGGVLIRNYLERCASTALKAGHTDQVYDELVNVVMKLNR